MKSNNKLGHSPLESTLTRTSKYDFITDPHSDEKVKIPFKTGCDAGKNNPFNINEEFMRENELRKVNYGETTSIHDIPLKVLNALKGYLKL